MERLKYDINKEALILALKHQEFFLNYQPLIDLYTNQIYGVEALLRWNHPRYGLIAPTDFIPLAEKTGVIVPITEWVLENALMDLRRLNEEGYHSFKLLVNISVRNIEEDNFEEMINDLLHKTRFNPISLELEITENIFMNPTKMINKKLHALRELGVKLSLDDFGTGYSSLQYLRNFPFDSIKIDKSFLENVDSDVINAAIVKSMITMGKAIGLNIIAEGVETEDQKEFLRNNHCDIVQGYLFSKPLELLSLIGFLSKVSPLPVSSRK